MAESRNGLQVDLSDPHAPLPACLHVDFVSRVHVGAKGLLAASVLYLL